MANMAGMLAGELERLDEERLKLADPALKGFSETVIAKKLAPLQA
ncbi:MAG: hypothetical protein ACO1SX_25160 [Actinomycetota bacterium]